MFLKRGGFFTIGAGTMQGLSRRMVTSVVGLICLVGLASPAQATLTLQLMAGNSSPTTITDTTGQGEIDYTNSSFGGIFQIKGLDLESNSATNGPGVFSDLNLSSLGIKNLTNMQQTLTISFSDTGFQPDGVSRPLMVANSASGTFKGGSQGQLTFQTFVSDGNQLFQTTGPGVVSPDPVVLTPSATGSTTMIGFSPLNAQFSITGVMTIVLDAGATVVGFNTDSLVHAPEPATTTLALTSIPLLTCAWRRSRRSSRG